MVFVCEGILFIDCFIIDVEMVKSVLELVEKKGFKMLDVLVFGGVVVVVGGIFMFMVGGDVDVFDKVYGVFSVMGKKIVYVGGYGVG